MRAAVTTLLSLVALTRFGHSADSDGGQCESGAGKATSRDDRIPGWKTAMFRSHLDHPALLHKALGSGNKKTSPDS